MIYIAQKPKPGPQGNTYDISPAQEYGEIGFIFDAYHTPSTSPKDSIELIRSKLKRFDPKTDYIVTAGGDPYASILIGYVLAEMNLPIRYLRFERLHSRAHDMQNPNVPAPKTGYYIPVEMPSSAYL